jgi:hypothetical protein
MSHACVLNQHACVLIRHACVLIESTRTAAHESYRGACRINTGFFTVLLWDIFWRQAWQKGRIIFIPKPGRTLYELAKSFRVSTNKPNIVSSLNDGRVG